MKKTFRAIATERVSVKVDNAIACQATKENPVKLRVCARTNAVDMGYAQVQHVIVSQGGLVIVVQRMPKKQKNKLVLPPVAQPIATATVYVDMD